jgi:hypothetical protein
MQEDLPPIGFLSASVSIRIGRKKIPKKRIRKMVGSSFLFFKTEEQN